MIPVHITKDAREKLWAYILSVKGEVGGFGFATLDAESRLVWYDCFLVDQDANASGVDFTDKGLTQAVDRAATTGFFDDPNGVWVWWHSHGSLEVFWSTTDEGGIEALKESGVKYMISVVGNHRLQTKTRIDVFDVPIIGHAEFHNAQLVRYGAEQFQYDVNAELREHVRIKPTISAKPGEDKTIWAKDGVWKSRYPGSEKDTGFKWDKDKKMYFRPYTDDELAAQAAAPELPEGSRKSDPGDKLDDALSRNAKLVAGEGYREYSQEELTGMSPDEQAWGTDADWEDVDDEGAGFNWHDCVGFATTDAEADAHIAAGGQVVVYKGEKFLMEADSTDPILAMANAAEGEIVEVHAS